MRTAYVLVAAVLASACTATVDKQSVKATQTAPESTQVEVVRIPYDPSLPYYVVTVEPLSFDADGAWRSPDEQACLADLSVQARRQRPIRAERDRKSWLEGTRHRLRATVPTGEVRPATPLAPPITNRLKFSGVPASFAFS